MSLLDHHSSLYAMEALHANWPAYPSGHGWQLALRSLAVFPAGVRFRQIDDIDECLLFVAVGRGPCLEPKDDVFDSRLFHVAVWRDDLLGLYERRLLTGCSMLTSHQAALAYYHKVKDVVFQTADGPRKLPHPEAYDFDDERPTVFHMDEDGLGLSPDAERVLRSLAGPLEALDPAIRERVLPLLSIPLFDTAVREAGVILESRLRHATASSSYGQALVEEYYNLLGSRNGGQSTAVSEVLRSELRMLFKFVRNEFAHELREITSDQCYVLLDRISDVLTTITEIETAARADPQGT